MLELSKSNDRDSSSWRIRAFESAMRSGSADLYLKAGGDSDCMVLGALHNNCIVSLTGLHRHLHWTLSSSNEIHIFNNIS